MFKKAFAHAALAFCLAFATLTSANAADNIQKAGDLEFTHVFARASATPMAKAGAAYFQVKNTGASADRLVGAKTDAADRAELHESVMKEGVMKMLPVEAVDLPAGGGVKFKPGGYHIMLMGLKAPLEENTTFRLTLVFEKAGEVTLTVPVRKATAKSDMDMDMD